MAVEPQPGERVVLITGATGGLGPAVARAFAEEGSALVLTSRHQDELDELVQSLGIRESRTLIHTADLTSPVEVTALVEAAEHRFGHVDVLIHVAGGFATNRRVAEIDLDAWRRMIALNFDSAVYLAHVLLPGMLARAYGKLVFVGSQTAQKPFPGSLGYATGKSALEVLVKTLSTENKRKGINTNMVTLSTLDTEANRESMPQGKAEEWVDPEDVARVIRFLASNEARAIHGAILPVWGVL